MVCMTSLTLILSFVPVRRHVDLETEIYKYPCNPTDVNTPLSRVRFPGSCQSVPKLFS